MKRILSTFFLFATAIGFIQAQLQEFTYSDLRCIKNIFNNIETRSVLVQALGRDNLKSIIIPSTITHEEEDEGGVVETYEVTGIMQQGFYNCSQLQNVIIPESITEIGARAFDGTAIYNNPDNWKDGALYVDNCLVAVNKDELPENLVIPEGTRLIADGVFENCTDLVQVTIPETVTSIGNNVFTGSGIYNNPNNWKDGALYVDNCLVAVNKDELSENLVIPEDTRLIANWTFSLYYRDNKKLQTVNIPGSVTHIGYSAFNSNTLEKVSLNKGTTHIGNCAFFACKNLKEVTLPDGLTHILNSAFNNCNMLTDITLPNQLIHIGSNAFLNCQLQRIVIPEHLTSISDGAFSGCYQLADLTLHDQVNYIGIEAFYNCHSLTQIVLPKGINKINRSTFGGCGFTELNIPAHIDTIGRNAFSGCSDMTKLTLSDSVRTIGDRAFAYCNKLTLVDIPANIDSIGHIIFTNCNALTDINVDAANSHYCSQDGILFTADKTVLMQYPSGKTTTTYNVPTQTTIIDHYAFADNQYLTEVHLPDRLKMLSSYAFFANEKLKTVYVGKETEYLDPYAFINCTALTEFKVDAASSTYSAQDGVLFLNGTDELVLYPTAKTDSIYTVPETTTIIGSNAFFYNKYLKEITIPNAVEKILFNAFSSCQQLEKVTIGTGLEYLEGNPFSGCNQIKEITLWAPTPPENGTIATDAPIYVSAKALPAYQASYEWNRANLQTLKFQDGTLRYHIYDWEEKTAAVISNPTDDGSNYTDLATTAVIPQETTYEEKTFTVSGIDNEAFKDCAQLEEITMPASVSIIGEEAFNGCTSLQKANLQGKIEMIGRNAFSGCTSLEEIAITSDTVTIGNDAFSECTSLKLASVAGCVEAIGNNAFYGCTALTQASFDGHVTTIGERAYTNCTSLEEITITGNTRTIEKEAFMNCTALKKANVLNGVQAIGENAFCDCTALTEITLPGTLSIWGDFAFSDCTALQSLTLNEGITTVSYGAFSDCIALTRIDFPSTLSRVENRAFNGCMAIKEITVRATTPPTLIRNPFNNVSQETTVYVPAEALEAYAQATSWKKFNLQPISTGTGIETITDPDDLHVVNGRLYNPQGHHIRLFDLNGRLMYEGTDTSVGMPEGMYIISCKGRSSKAMISE